MKKTTYFAWMIAAGLAMTGCSDELEGGGGTGGTLDGETGYVKVAINLPTTSGFTTRADDGLKNDQFDDGTADEYKVNDVYLLIFQGENEGSAVFRSAYDMNLSWNDANTPEDDNVTSLSFLQSQKTLWPNTRIAGNWTSTSDSHPLKALFPIISIFLRSISFNCRQLRKHSSLISFVDIFTVVIALHSAKA